MSLLKKIAELGKRKGLPVITGAVIGLAALAPKANAQGFNPAELPFNSKGFVYNNSMAVENGTVSVYNTLDNRLLAQTEISRADTMNTATGQLENVAGFYDLIIPTDIASTPEIEGARNGDELYFRITRNDGFDYNLSSDDKTIIHAPGQIKRWDFNVKDKVSVNEEVPEMFRLNQNYPNPFNPSTRVGFSLGEREYITLDVYNAAGQKVRTLTEGYMDAGNHELTFSGEGLAAGAYFLRMQAGDYTDTKKMSLIK
jgi:hypothetical protein